jgi:uncharacterized protein (TIGR02300 family)
MSCGARFYDLNKKPIICPNCAVEFTGEIKVKSRRGRLPAETDEEDVIEDKPVAVLDDEIAGEGDQDVETVSLDELEEDGEEDEEDVLAIEEDLEIDEELDDIDDEDIEEDIAEDDEK